MAVSVYIPTPFRRLTGNRTRVEAGGDTVGEVLQHVNEAFPGFAEMLYDDQRAIPAHINVYVNNREIHTLQGEATPVADGDEVAVIPAIAGGAGEPLRPDQVTRYSRHIIMPQVGPVGQRKLMGAKVLVVGAGGLGSPVALYLALAGVGTLGLVDFDVVDLSNLQRQILHQNKDVGRPKVESARETLNAYNPDVNVVTHEVPLTSDNALEIIPQYDIIVNGADNFATRYLVNDACYLSGKPLVDGSILLFDGQASTYIPGKGCYRCLFPEPPPPGMVPSCAEAGVLGALCGTIGSIQATEVLKLILGVGEPLVGRLALYDALALEMRVVKTRRDPKCPLCGDNPTVTQLIDYDAFCGGPPHKEGAPVAAG
jgi:molybdopterin/thiamine biosynthesis adenylyltransferase/molybdopterin converting factor small subunit